MNIEENAEKVEKKKVSKKWIIIPLAVVITIISVVLVIVLKKDKSVHGIEVNGKIYEYSAEKGIADYQNIEGKVYVSDMISVFSYEIGSTGKKVCEDVNVEDITTYMVPDAYTRFRNDEVLQEKIFVFAKNFKTDDGITNKSTIEDIKNKDYRCTFGKEYTRFTDSKGNDSWDEADELLAQILEEGSFQCIKFIDQEMISLMPDILKTYYWQDDVEGFFAQLEEITDNDSKDVASCLIACASLIKKTTDGEIDFFVEKRFAEYRIDQNGNLLVDIRIITLKENVEKWDDNWGVSMQ